MSLGTPAIDSGRLGDGTTGVTARTGPDNWDDLEGFLEIRRQPKSPSIKIPYDPMGACEDFQSGPASPLHFNEPSTELVGRSSSHSDLFDPSSSAPYPRRSSQDPPMLPRTTRPSGYRRNLISHELQPLDTPIRNRRAPPPKPSGTILRRPSKPSGRPRMCDSPSISRQWRLTGYS